MKFLDLIKNPFGNVALVIVCAFTCLLCFGNENGSHNFEGLFAILVFLFSGFATLSLYLLVYIITKVNYWFISWIGVIIMICMALLVF